MGSNILRDPRARSSALDALGILQPRAFRSLNHVDPFDSVSNLLYKTYLICQKTAVLNILPVSFVFNSKSKHDSLLLVSVVLFLGLTVVGMCC